MIVLQNFNDVQLSGITHETGALDKLASFINLIHKWKTHWQ